MNYQRMAVILADIIVKLTELHGLLMSPEEPRAAWKAASEVVQKEEETAMLRKINNLETDKDVIAYITEVAETLNAMNVPRAARIREVARARIRTLRLTPAHGEDDQRPHDEIEGVSE